MGEKENRPSWAPPWERIAALTEENKVRLLDLLDALTKLQAEQEQCGDSRD